MSRKTKKFQKEFLYGTAYGIRSGSAAFSFSVLIVMCKSTQRDVPVLNSCDFRRVLTHTHKKLPRNFLASFLVPRTGFEPVISWMRTRYPGPLDERGRLGNYSKKCSFLQLINNPAKCRIVYFKKENLRAYSEPIAFALTAEISQFRLPVRPAGGQTVQISSAYPNILP